MSLAPEIILPGCFQQAQAAQRNSNTIKGNLLFCLCALFGLLTLITLASFIWHFSDAIANLILFIRCGAGISYTIILNISGHDGKAIVPPQMPSQPANDDRIDQLTQTVNTLTAQLTTVLSITQNNNFLVSPLQEVSQVETPLPLVLPESLQSSIAIPSPHLSTTIQPLYLNIRKGQTDLHLLALIDQHTTVDSDGPRRKPVREGRVPGLDMLMVSRRQVLKEILNGACAALLLSPYMLLPQDTKERLDIITAHPSYVDDEAINDLATITQSYWTLSKNASIDLLSGVAGHFTTIAQLLKEPHSTPITWFLSAEQRKLVNSENERIQQYRKKGDLL